MRADQLSFNDLIESKAITGEISFNDKRMSLVSTEALGLFRHDLLDTLGMERTKGFLMRYGWSCGVKDGRELASMYEWESMKELMLAGPLVHSLLGVVTAKPKEISIRGENLYYSGTWENSFEAIEHINHHGISEDNGCWTLIGYASGYLTETFGKDVIAYETHCMGRGDDVCRFEAKTLDSYDLRAQKMMKYYKAESISSELDQAQSELNHINQSIIESDHVHQQLTNLLVEDKSLYETVAFLSQTIQKSVVIDYYNKTIESAFINAEDEKTYNNWTHKFVYEEERKNDIRTYPIMANNVNLGRLVIISRERITNRDELIIKRAVNIFNVQMYHQWKIMHSIWKKRENFFEAMLEDMSIDEKQFERNAHLFHFHPRHLNRVLSIQLQPQDKHEEILELLEVSHLLESSDFFMSKRRIIVILSEEKAENPTKFVEKMKQEIEINSPGTKCYFGIGREANNIPLLRESYQDSTAISEFSMLTNPSQSHVASYENMGSIMMFIKGSDQQELIHFYKQIIGELIKYDDLNDSDYLLTLKTYLDYNGNLQQTADSLHLSVAGLRYRIERIENLCAIDLKTGEARFNCQLAIQIHYSITLKM